MKIFVWIFTVVAVISLVAVSIFSAVLSHNFSKNCGEYLKLSGDAPTIERADYFLGKAVNYIERRGLTSGNSALIFKTPNSDVGIWYGQLKAAKETTGRILEKISKDPESVSQLERDNSLMKIREVVSDDSFSGTVVTVPEKITWFPNQWPIAIWWTISIVCVISGGLLILFDI